MKGKVFISSSKERQKARVRLEERILTQELGARIGSKQWNRRPDGMTLSKFYQSKKTN